MFNTQLFTSDWIDERYVNTSGGTIYLNGNAIKIEYFGTPLNVLRAMKQSEAFSKKNEELIPIISEIIWA